MADSVAPVLDAGLVRLVEMDHRISDEVWLEPKPGHTPGNVSVRLRSEDAEAVITGDLMHHPVQVAEPEWSSHFDSDVERRAGRGARSAHGTPMGPRSCSARTSITRPPATSSATARPGGSG
jgi:glyoxylase-like metal-dependent hydrolase (beta-lactamase superfamily II)